MIRQAVDKMMCKTAMKIMCIVAWGLAAFAALYAICTI